MQARRIARGAAIGLAAGLVASFAMDRAQRLFQGGSDDHDEGEPATEKVADRASRALSGAPVLEPDKPRAGQFVHYGFGAGLGIAYGIAGAQWSGVTVGFGTLFGLGVALTADEMLVPAAGLGPSPTETPPATHVYSMASHLVFGLALEGTRRVLDRAL